MFELLSDTSQQDEVVECDKVISEATGMCFLTDGEITDVGTPINNKRKAYSLSLSPSSVIGALSGFSCETSSSSIDLRFPATAAMPMSTSSSPEWLGKRARRLAPSPQ
jgi:cyclin D3, plant